jgi:hypothetical protein
MGLTWSHNINKPKLYAIGWFRIRKLIYFFEIRETFPEFLIEQFFRKLCPIDHFDTLIKQMDEWGLKRITLENNLGEIIIVERNIFGDNGEEIDDDEDNDDDEDVIYHTGG